ncbi:MAG: S-methyl-5-thioribose-1-phosphate isomerase [Gallionellales bacterium GWA2_60_142]|nr:MAG: S-methyl-5-thioribose-1-phosphate isomerase [Gallionellales bacterium GWA2_60_142]HCI14591.1 S-methyl-5-thioribose-1-phosphate isomerase [Gallionellaceae bacterium]
MKVNGKPYRTIWSTADGAVEIIDQTKLPHEFVTMRLENMRDAERAIRDMWVRGAPLIGVTAAYGVALSMKHHASDAALEASCGVLLAARPTAVNLRWGVERMRAFLAPLPESERAGAAWLEAARIADEDVEINASIGRYGAELIRAMHESKQREGRSGVVNILTHCNAGWLATVDWGTALAPIYAAFDAGVPLHVWVDETRPRNQGASLTAWELGQHGVPHTVIVDNAGGHLMQHGLVDMAIVGTDRVTATGDVCNKIGTYLKALAAHDNGVPFYIGLPTPTIDWTLNDGVKEIPIEERAQEEVTHIAGLCDDGQVRTVQVTPTGSRAANYGFDVTPARLVTGLITERGVVAANAQAMECLK